MDTIEIYLESSFFGLLFFLSLFVMLLGVMWIIPFSHEFWVNFTIKVLGSIGLIRHFFQIVDLHFGKHHKNSVNKIWVKKDHFEFETREGRRSTGLISGDSFVSEYLIILRLKLKKRIRTILIPADALGVDEYRILCTHLKFQRKYAV